MTTKISFYLEADGSGDVFAYFPEDDHDIHGNFKVCYSHVGQHGSCSPDYVKECQPATPEQYSDLLKELVNYGYTKIEIISHAENKDQ